MKWFKNLFGRRAKDASQPKKVRLQLETLEERQVLSTINWVNQGIFGNDVDGFESVFGAKAALARGVVAEAIHDWEQVIADFNYSDGGNTFNLTVKMADDGAAPGANGGPGDNNKDPNDDGWLNGKPTKGIITIGRGSDLGFGDNRGDGGGIYLDPTPARHEEFLGRITNDFVSDAQSGSPAAGLNDLYSTVLHEIGHTVGFTGDTRGLLRFLNKFEVLTGVADDVSGRLASTANAGYLWGFIGPSGAHLMTSYDSGGATGMPRDSGFGAHSAPAGTVVTLNGTNTIRGEADLMNPSWGYGERRLIPNSMARILRDAYGYDINLPSTIDTFQAVTVTIPHVWQIDNPDGPDNGDYYAVVYIDGGQGVTSRITGKDFDTDWAVTKTVDASLGSVPVRIELWDYDRDFRFGDDQMRISSRGADLALDLRMDLATGKWSGEVDHPTDTSRGDSPDPDAQIRFAITLRPKLATLSGELVVDNGVLIVSGDQLGANFADRVIVERGDLGGMKITLNDRVFQSAPDISGIIINTRGGSDTITVLATLPNVPVTINAGTGDDTVVVGNGNLDNIQGTLTIFGGGGNDRLEVHDEGNYHDGGSSYTVAASFVSRVSQTLTMGGPFAPTSYAAAVGYSGIEDLAIGTRADTILFQGNEGSAVTVLGTSAATTVTGGAGDDTFTVGSPSDLLRLSGPLTINGGGGSNRLHFLESANTSAGVEYTIGFEPGTGQQLVRRSGPPGFAEVRYNDIGALELSGGASGAVINYHGSDAATTINGGGGDDAINVGRYAYAMDDATLTVNGGGGADRLVFEDNANFDNSGTTYTIGPARVSRVGVDVESGFLGFFSARTSAVTIDQSGIESLLVSGGRSGNTITFWGNEANTTIAGGQGDDIINVGPHGFWHLAPTTLTVDGGDGSNRLEFNDQAGWGNQRTQYTVSNGSVQRLANYFFPTPGGATISVEPFLLAYGNIQDLHVNAAHNGSTINVEGTGANTTTINGGNWDDRIVVGRVGTLDWIGPLTINGQGGSDELVLDDRANANSANRTTLPTFEITSRDVTRSNQVTLSSGDVSVSVTTASTVAYSDVERLTIQSGASTDVFNVRSTAADTAVTIDAGYGNDTFNVGNAANTLDDIRGALTIDDEIDWNLGHLANSADTLNLNDQGNTTPGQTYTVTATGLDRTGAARITYGTTWYDTINIHAGSGGNYVNIQNVAGLYTYTNLYSGSGDDRVDVLATSHASFLAVDGGAGANVIRVGSASQAPDDTAPHGGTMAGLSAGVISLWSSGPGRTTVVVDDSGDTTSRNVTIVSSAIWSGLAAATIYWWPVDRQIFYGGSGGNTFNLDDQYYGAGMLDLYAGSGNDTIHVNNLEAYPYWSHDFGIHGQGGMDTLQINDQSATRGATYTVGADSLTRVNRNPAFSWDSSVTVGFDGLENLVINAGSGADTFDIQSTAAGTGLGVFAGAGNDTFNVGSTTNTLDTILGPVTVDGQTGANTSGDTLNINDQGTLTGQVYALTGSTLDRTGAARITYRNLGMNPFGAFGANLVVNAANPTSGGNVLDVSSTPGDYTWTWLKSGSGNDRVNVLSTALAGFLWIDGVSGSDTVRVGSTSVALGDTAARGGTLAGIQGFSNIWNSNGTTALVMDDSGDPTVHANVVLHFTELQGLAPNAIHWQPGQVNNVIVYGGGSPGTGNVFNVMSLSPIPLTINTGPGNDTVNVQDPGTTYSSYLLTVNGQGGTNTLNLNDQASAVGRTYTITAAAVTRTNQSLAVNYGNIVNLAINAGSGNDTFALRGTPAGTSVRIDGGGGPDTLDYAANTTAVTVNLLSGAATGLAGGVRNVENVTGGSGNDVLVGNAAANVFVGGAGNDVLLGGAGADTLLGGAGRDLLVGGTGADVLDGGAGDDIIIGGTIAHFIESTGAVNKAALDAVMGEWGRTGITYSRRITNLRNRGLLSRSVVFDDGAVDSLTGGADDLDWFFGQSTEVKDRQRSGMTEVLN